MRVGFRSFVAAAVLCAAPFDVIAQVNLQPTPAPTVTAEERAWFLAREPVVFAGSLYYPSGPQVYFNRFEMIRSGYYDWVPLYTRTTLEPYSILYVPIAGGLMQPYERRRSGELAGTAGSTAPSFPIVRPAATAEASEELSGIPQAAGPPTGIGPSLTNVVPQSASMLGMNRALSPTERSLPTTGVAAPAPRTPFRSAARPEGLNGVFIEYANKRWFNRGPAVTLNPAELIASGTYRGLPVYVKRGDETTIYVPVVEPGDTMVTPYSLGPAKRR